MAKANILIVEDEVVTALEMESTLEEIGYTVISIVDTGEEAVAIAKEEKPDIVLMDIRLQGEMDGIDTAEIIRSEFGIPVIFSTAFLDEERIERAKITMPFGYVLKPIQESDLKVTIEMALYVTKMDSERRKLEEVLKENEERFRLMMRQSPSVIELYNTDGLQIEVNKAYEELWDFPAITTVNKFNVLKSKEVEDTGLMKYVKAAYAGKSVQVPPYQFDPTGETEAKGKGRVRWLNTRIYPLKDKENIVKNIVITHEDVSEQKQIEQALKESEEKYRKLFEDSIDGNALADPETGIILECNQALANLVGRTKEELIGQPRHLLHPAMSSEAEFSPTFEKQKTEKQGERIETKIITKSGELKDVVILANTFKMDGKEIIHGVFRDITEQKRAENAFRESEEKFRSVAEQSIVGIYIIQGDVFKYVNPRFAEYFGYTVSECLDNLRFEKLVHPDDLSTVEAQVEKRLKREVKSVNYKFKGIKKNGEIINVEIFGSSISFNNRPAAIGTLLDITNHS
ncbi:MAG: PAS domain S-box protein [Deltaproteobacteria bacterium]|jgi:PAS domain S-box-containing protein|nr:PAS domain S-box protein [Deltaproteobacteria bacterium]